MSTIPDATALAGLVRSRQASPRELVDEAIARCEEVNDAINAVIHPRFDRARAEADAVELATAGPFAGVPFVVKDLGCPMAGEPHHQGSVGLRDAGVMATEDAYLYRRFRDLGLIAIGRTNVPEFGTTITTEPAAYGPTRNPWNLGHSTGGSSGGSAAAVAAGIVPIGHANDGGGSIRIPASECGLVGLKPSRGRVSRGPHEGESWAGATIDGVVTRSVRDTAAVLDGISGYEPGDPYTAPPPRGSYVDSVGADRGTLRIGLAASVPHGSFHPECVAAVEETGVLLEALGHQVEMAQPAALADEDFSRHFGVIMAASAASDFALLAELLGRPLTADDVEGDNWALAEMGRRLTAETYLASVLWTHRWQRRMLAWWATDGYDVLVAPTLGSPPPELGWLRDPRFGTRRLQEILLTTAQFNVSGQPAVSLPLHWTADGLPVGVQFVGAAFGEDVLLSLAGQIELAAPWAHRRPPLTG